MGGTRPDCLANSRRIGRLDLGRELRALRLEDRYAEGSEITGTRKTEAPRVIQLKQAVRALGKKLGEMSASPPRRSRSPCRLPEKGVRS